MRRCCTSAIPRWTMRLLAFYGAMLTRDATGAAVEDALDYSRQTLARLESSDQCRLAFGNGKTQVATAEDAYPDAGIRSCRAGHCSPCRCSMQKEAASPAFSTDGARGRAIIAKETRGCTNPLRVNCSLYFGAQHCKVEEIWLDSSPKVGSSSMRAIDAVLRRSIANSSRILWTRPFVSSRDPACRPVSHTHERFIFVRDPFDKLLSAFLEIAGGKGSRAAWIEEFRKGRACPVHPLIEGTDDHRKQAHRMDRLLTWSFEDLSAVFNEFVKDIGAGFRNFHMLSQTYSIVASPSLPTFIGQLEHASDGWASFLDGLGLSDGRLALPFTNAKISGRPKSSPTKRPTLAALDPDAQAVFCSFYRQDYECLGYALPPECRDTTPATQLCGIDHADRGGTARAISKRAQGQ